ncbi:hypothetical protein BX666DRAFT_1904710 [Dichotomocladium elegans]|nr:hypothetical protein BX666DRAFT_1904710 [Dichotomocladium elegans]
MKLTSGIVFLVSMALILLAQKQEQAPSQGKANDVCAKDIMAGGQGDFDAIKSCKVYTGSITLEKPTMDQLVLEGVETIKGNLIIRGSETLTSIRAPQLKVVEGELVIGQNTHLERLELPSLTDAKSLTLAVLPNLEKIDFVAGLSNVQDLTIQDVRPAQIDGLKMETLHSFTLLENTLIKSFELQVKDISGKLAVLGNNHDMSFSAPNLLAVQSAEFRNLQSLNLDALQRINSDVSLHENYFTSLHLDSVQDIGGTLSVANNDKLVDVSFKKLSLITGALSIGNNSQIQVIDGFPALSSVHGTVDLAGSFSRYDLPSLQDVRGGMRIQTSSGQFPCMEVEKKFKDTSVVKGSIWGCKSNMDTSAMDPTIGQTDGSSSSGGLSTGGSGSSSSLPPNNKQQLGDKNAAKSGNTAADQSASAATTTRASIAALAIGLLGALTF